MTKKFDRILSDDWLPLEFQSGNDVPVTSLLVNLKTLKSIIQQTEQAVLAKLAEQEPVATVSQETFSNDGTSDIITSNLPIGTPLYAHPCVSPTSDKTAYVSEKVESETQASSQGFLDSSNHIADKRKMVGLSLSVDTKETQALLQSYLDGIDGWQLVPVKPTKEMHLAARDWSVRKYGKAIGLEASYGCYKTMLAAAPKYTGESK